MQTLAPIAVTAAPITIDLNQVGIDRTAMAAILLTNTSSTFLQVIFGAGTDYLEPGRSDLFQINSTTVSTLVLIPVIPLGATLGFVYATVYTVNDPISQTYPVAAPIIGSGSVLVSALDFASSFTNFGLLPGPTPTGPGTFYPTNGGQCLDIYFQSADALASTNRTSLAIAWSDSSQGLALDGSADVLLEGPYIIGGGKTLRFRTPVKAPYVSIQLTSGTGITNTYRIKARILSLAPTVPVCTLEDRNDLVTNPPGQLIMQGSGGIPYGAGTVVNASTTLTIPLQAYFGMAMLWVDSPAGFASIVSLIQTNLAAVNQLITQVVQTTASSATPGNNLTMLVYLPAGDNSIKFNNMDAGASHTFFASLTPVI